MEKFITYDNLRYFAYSNDHICQKPIRGIVMDFWGLGSTGMYHEDTETGKFYAEQGIIFLIPYMITRSFSASSASIFPLITSTCSP